MINSVRSALVNHNPIYRSGYLIGRHCATAIPKHTRFHVHPPATGAIPRTKAITSSGCDRFNIEETHKSTRDSYRWKKPHNGADNQRASVFSLPNLDSQIALYTRKIHFIHAFFERRDSYLGETRDPDSREVLNFFITNRWSWLLIFRHAREHDCASGERQSEFYFDCALLLAVIRNRYARLIRIAGFNYNAQETRKFFKEWFS